MAKKFKRAKAKPKGSFAPTKAQLATIQAITKKVTTKASALEESIEEVKFSLPTRFESFNRATGYDGIPIGQMMELHGPENVGKTLWLLSILADAQQQGHISCLLELEKSIDPKDAKTTGLDLKSLVNLKKLEIPPSVIRETTGDTIERVSVGVNRLIRKFKDKRGPEQFLIIGIDSMPALLCERQVKEGTSKSTYGAQTAMIGEWQKVLNMLIGKSHAVSVVFINQERSNIPSGYSMGKQPDWKPWGGQAAHFFINLRARIGFRSKIKMGDKLVGNGHYGVISKTKRGKEGSRFVFCSKVKGKKNLGLWVPEELLLTGMERGLFKKVTGGYRYRKKKYSHAEILEQLDQREEFFRKQIRGIAS